MPANTKYLSSPLQRWLKISAAIIGGYFVCSSFHLWLAGIKPISEYVILFSGMTFFLMWPFLMIITFLFRNGGTAWALYLAVTLTFGLLIWIQQIP